MPRLYGALVLLLIPASLSAQETFAPLTAGLKPGEKVEILADAPCATEPCYGRLITGRIRDLTATSIVLEAGRQRHELSAMDVRHVERPGDRIWNGVLAGFGIGFSVGFLAVIADGCDAGEWCILSGPSFAAAFGLLTGGVGSGIGALTDAAISKPRVVFDAGASPSRRVVNVAPIVGRGGSGVKVSVRF